MREFITDRTQAEVVRCKELAAKGWNNMTEAEKAEWYGTAMRGAYNYSDLNRVESAVAELSEFLELGLVTKINWGVWDAPTQADMSRYISNLQIVKERCASREGLPTAMTGFTYEYANSIEKMLSEAYVNKDTHNVWKKTAVTPKYVDKYTRVYDHERIGTTGVNIVSSFDSGEIRASQNISFSEQVGFYAPSVTHPIANVVGWYDVLLSTGSTSVCVKITETPRQTGHRDIVIEGTTIRTYIFEYSYEVVGYATLGPVREWVVGDSLGGVLVPSGHIPKGTLIEGSLADGYCYVQDVDGKYYYYELR